MLLCVQVLQFVQEHTEYGQEQLAGNSVHVDRVFLQRYMPELTQHLHYRIVDVSTLKELCRWVHGAQQEAVLGQPLTAAHQQQYSTCFDLGALQDSAAGWCICVFPCMTCARLPHIC
jgi:hypothetical protein